MSLALNNSMAALPGFILRKAGLSDLRGLIEAIR